MLLYLTHFIKSPTRCNNILDLLFYNVDSFVSNFSVFEPFGPLIIQVTIVHYILVLTVLINQHISNIYLYICSKIYIYALDVINSIKKIIYCQYIVVLKYR